MKLPYEFNCKDIVDGVAPGTYRGTIVQAEVKETKAGDGMYLAVLFYLDGGGQIYHNINLANPSEMAVRIGQRELKKLCIACGIESVNDTESFLNKVVSVTIKEKDGRGEVVDVRPCTTEAVAPEDIPF